MRKIRQSYLDGEKLYRRWFEMGAGASAIRLQRWAVTEGMLSPEGNVPSVMGVWKAMWRWASLKENKDVAKELFLDFVRNREWRLKDLDLPWDGDPDELWRLFMLQKIETAWQFTPARNKRFLKENGWI